MMHSLHLISVTHTTSYSSLLSEVMTFARIDREANPRTSLSLNPPVPDQRPDQSSNQSISCVVPCF